MSNWIDLPNSADTAQQLVRMLMPDDIKYFSCGRYRGPDHDFWGVSIHAPSVVASNSGDTISEALTKAVQEFWGKYHDAGDIA